MKYKYLVAAALQEELNAFTNLLNGSSSSEHINDGVDKIIYEYKQKSVEILTFSADKMGMPYNAAKLMEIILKFDPRFTLFIGTCAGLKKHPLGSVLIPHRVFSYESGKYEEGIFHPDYSLFYSSDLLRKCAETLNDNLKRRGLINYNVITDEDFGSGSAVINDEYKKKEIIENGARKLSGLDMEAYSIGCINHILKSTNDLLIIKGISDNGENKNASENKGHKEFAKRNAANFAFELIKHLEDKNIVPDKLIDKLDISTSFVVDENQVLTYPFKLVFHITNNTQFDIIIKSLSFTLNLGIEIQKGTGRDKPMFFLGYQFKSDKPIITDTLTLKKGDTAKECWIPINEKITKDVFIDAVRSKKIGIWNYQTYVLKECVTLDNHEEPF